MTIYGLADATDDALLPRYVYVGRTRRGVDMRLNWHRWSRHARWLKTSNEELAAWLDDHDPVAVPLEEVPGDVDPWQAEKAWIEKFAAEGLLNIVGNPLRSRKRRSGRWPPAAAA